MIFASIGEALNRHFSLVVLGSIFIGFLFPELGGAPKWLLPAILGFEIFVASFRVSHEELRGISLSRVTLFYIIRYLLLPLAIGLIFVRPDEPLILAIFLFLLLPPGVTSPSFSNLFGGNVTFTFLLVTGGSLLAPIVIPSIFEVATGEAVQVDSFTLFQTLLLIIIFPILLHIPVRKLKKVSSWINNHTAFLVIPMVSASIFLPIAKKHDFIFENFDLTLKYFGISLLLFLFLYAISFFIYRKTKQENHVSFTLGAGLNNITLGVVLALLYFDAHVTIFMVAGNVSATIALAIVKKMLCSH